MSQPSSPPSSSISDEIPLLINSINSANPPMFLGIDDDNLLKDMDLPEPPSLPLPANGELNYEEEELEWITNKDAFPPLESAGFLTAVIDKPAVNFILPPPPSPPALKAPVRDRSRADLRRSKRIKKGVGRLWCRHCNTEESSQWRTRWAGSWTLCNACGVRYQKGTLYPEYRPINSPDFLKEGNSNWNKRIMKIRRKKADVIMIMAENL